MRDFIVFRHFSANQDVPTNSCAWIFKSGKDVGGQLHVTSLISCGCEESRANCHLMAVNDQTTARAGVDHTFIRYHVTISLIFDSAVTLEFPFWDQ